MDTPTLIYHLVGIWDLQSQVGLSNKFSIDSIKRKLYNECGNDNIKDGLEFNFLKK